MKPNPRPLPMNPKERVDLICKCLGYAVTFGLGIGLSIAPLSAGTISYTHDAAGRLTGASHSDGKFIGYTYDNAGNLTLRQFAVIGVGDSDGDGMDDTWEFDYFQTLARDGSGDFDADGMTDLNEFRAGTLPDDPVSLFAITGFLSPPALVTIQWASVVGKKYQVQYTDSLAPLDWTNLGGEITAANTVTSVPDLTPSRTNRFYRVRLVP